MSDRDRMTTLRELLRDALEIARTAPSESADGAAKDVYGRAREHITAALTVLDDFASRA